MFSFDSIWYLWTETFMGQAIFFCHSASGFWIKAIIVYFACPLLVLAFVSVRAPAPDLPMHAWVSGCTPENWGCTPGGWAGAARARPRSRRDLPRFAFWLTLRPEFSPHSISKARATTNPYISLFEMAWWDRVFWKAGELLRNRKPKIMPKAL